MKGYIAIIPSSDLEKSLRFWVDAPYLALALALVANTAVAQTKKPWQPTPGHNQVEIWPDAAPNPVQLPGPEESGPVQGARPWTYVSNVSRPTITVYLPAGRNTGAAVLVFPGGGYQALAIDLEGTEICDWLVVKGITCVLLKYRVPKTGPSYQPDCECWINPKPAPALQDAQRAMGIVRARAAEWHIDPKKVGVLGFSAGGHLVAAISNDFEHRSYQPVDATDRQSARPDFAVAIYPGHLWVLGEAPLSLNPDIHVTKNTPPTFLLHAEDDPTDNVNHSLAYYNALRDAGVPTEVHFFAKGGHAFGLRRTADPITEWPQLVEKWLRTIGILSR